MNCKYYLSNIGPDVIERRWKQAEDCYTISYNEIEIMIYINMLYYMIRYTHSIIMYNEDEQWWSHIGIIIVKR